MPKTNQEIATLKKTAQSLCKLGLKPDEAIRATLMMTCTPPKR